MGSFEAQNFTATFPELRLIQIWISRGKGPKLATNMSRLFQPLKIGDFEVEHRVMMAPLTRYRCDDDWVPLPMVKGTSN